MGNADNSDHDLLRRVAQDVGYLRQEFDKVSNGTGFNRCVERLGLIENIKVQVERHEKRFLWQDRLVISTLVVLVIKWLWTYGWPTIDTIMPLG